MISLRAFNHASAFAKCSLPHSWYVYFRTTWWLQSFSSSRSRWRMVLLCFVQKFIYCFFSCVVFFGKDQSSEKACRQYLWWINRTLQWMRPLFCFLPHSINWLWHFIAVGKLFNSLIIRIKWFAVAIDDAFCPTMLSIAYLRCFSCGTMMNPCQKYENIHLTLKTHKLFNSWNYFPKLMWYKLNKNSFI